MSVPSRGGPSVRNRFRKIFELGDVQNGAVAHILRETVSVEVDPHFNRVLGDERHVVIGDVRKNACRQTCRWEMA